MTNNGFYTAATLLISGALPAFAAEDMNIVLFMVDDMGVNDTSVRFLSGGSPLNAYYRTPNMERLAEKGVRFTKAYAHPVSSPSRVSLMTGVNPARHKVTNWTLEPDTPTDTFPRRSKTAPQPWNWNGITPNAAADAVQSNLFEATCFPEILRQNGYKTIHVGKAHWGAVGTTAADPLNLGFDVNIGGCAAGGLASYTIDDSSQPYAFNAAGDYPFPSLNEYAEADTGFHITDAITAAAKSEIDKAVEEDRPFYLYVSHYAVHTPHQSDKRFSDDYKGSRSAYATLVAGMDRSLGELLDHLEAKNLSDKTIVIFMADNGGHHSTGNAPLRGSKGALFEGGIREPLIVCWPGVTDAYAGGVNDSPVIIEDFYPTILEMAGVGTVPAEIKQGRLDGISFVSAIKTGSTCNADRSLVFHYPNWWGEEASASRKMRVPVGRPASALIKDGKKIIHFYETGETRLYDLDADETEKREAEDDVLKAELASELTAFLKNAGASMVYDKKTQTVTWPDGSSEKPAEGF